MAFYNAYYAGFIDGAWEIAEMGYSIAEFSGAWNPLHPVFHTQTGMDIRQKTMDVLAMLKKLASADDTFGQVKSLVKNEVVKYIDETVSLDAQGRYNQGKLIFEVASAFFGVAEAKALLKTGKLTSNLLSGLAKIPVRLSNVSKVMKALPGKLKKLQNNTLAYALSANTYIEIARFTDEGGIIAEKWIDEPVEILETIGEVTYKKADNIAETTAELGVVKDAKGGYGLGLVNTLFSVGEEIVGISIKRIKHGISQKYAIIGRSMGNAEITGVRNVYAELKNVRSLDVEIFDGSSLTGSWKTAFDDAVVEFAEKTDNWTKHLSNQELLQLKMYKLNKDWANKLISEGYTVLDMGDFNNLGFSAFYAMEKQVIFK